MNAKNINPELLLKEREKISALLKQRRMAKGKTMRDMAKEVGTSYSTIGKIETGKWNFGIETLAAFCEVLDLEINITPRKK